MPNLWKLFFPKIQYGCLMAILENGSLEERRRLLVGHETINYVNGVDYALMKYERPDHEQRSISLYKTHRKGEFELAIFYIPWQDGADDLPFLPLIIHRRTEKVWGIMLPFNELHNIITPQQDSQIGELAMIWTNFAMEQRFGIKLDL